MVALERSFGIQLTRRALLSVAAASAAAIAFAPPAAWAADDPPEQKKLAKASVLKNGADWLQSQRLPSGAFPLGDGAESILASTGALHALVAVRNVGIDVDIDPTVDYLSSNPEPNEMEAQMSYLGAEWPLALAEAGVDPRDAGG